MAFLDKQQRAALLIILLGVGIIFALTPYAPGLIGIPVSYAIDGRQYVAVQSGFGIDARAMQGRLNRLNPGEYPEVPEGGAVWVFAVK